MYNDHEPLPDRCGWSSQVSTKHPFGFVCPTNCLFPDQNSPYIGQNQYQIWLVYFWTSLHYKTILCMATWQHHLVGHLKSFVRISYMHNFVYVVSVFRERSWGIALHICWLMISGILMDVFCHQFSRGKPTDGEMFSSRWTRFCCLTSAGTQRTTRETSM